MIKEEPKWTEIARAPGWRLFKSKDGSGVLELYVPIHMPFVVLLTSAQVDKLLEIIKAEET